MRQFRTSTDSVFDIDDDEGTGTCPMVSQAGPPAEEGSTAPQDAERPAGPRTPAYWISRVARRRPSTSSRRSATSPTAP